MLVRYWSIAVLIGVLSTALAKPALAAADTIGATRKLGVGLGGSSLANGVTAKYYLSSHGALQASAGVVQSTHAYEDGQSLAVDYVHELGNFWDPPYGRLFWGLGAGILANFHSAMGSRGTDFAIAGVFEVGWHFKDFPLELTVDARPTFYLGDSPETSSLWPYGGGAVRWFF